MSQPTSATTFVRNYNFIENVVRKKSFWLIFFVFTFGFPIYRSMNRELPPELPNYFQVPHFRFVDEFNKPFGSDELKGKFYLASFMFTSCPTSCPGLMEKVQKVQKRVRGLGTKVALVTFTVDPETDTPKVLNKFARDLKANPFVWKFVTGDHQKIYDLVVNGFKLAMGGKEPIQKLVDNEEVDLIDIVHSEKLVLVDKTGMIRGYYSTDKNSINKLMIDLGILVNRHKIN